MDPNILVCYKSRTCITLLHISQTKNQSSSRLAQMACINYNHPFVLKRSHERIRFNFSTRVFETLNPQARCPMPGIGNNICKWFFAEGFDTRSLSGAAQFANATDLNGNKVKLDRSGNGALHEDISERTLNSILRSWTKAIHTACQSCNNDYTNPTVRRAIYDFKPVSQNPLTNHLRQYLLFDSKPEIGRAPGNNNAWIPVGAEVPVSDFKVCRATGIDLVVRDCAGQYIAIELKWGYLGSFSKKSDPAKRSEEAQKWLKPPLQLYPANAKYYALLEVMWGALMFEDTYQEKLVAAIAMNVNIQGVTVAFDGEFVVQATDLLLQNLADMGRRRKELQLEKRKKKHERSIKDYDKDIERRRAEYIVQAYTSDQAATAAAPLNSSVPLSSSLQPTMSSTPAEIKERLQKQIDKARDMMDKSNKLLQVQEKALKDLEAGKDVAQVNGFLQAAAFLLKDESSKKKRASTKRKAPVEKQKKPRKPKVSKSKVPKIEPASGSSQLRLFPKVEP